MNPHASDAPPAGPPTVARQTRPSFLFVCRDGPDAARLRVEHLDGHLAHVEAHWRRYVAAGPLRVPGETAIAASAFLLFADDLDDAWALMRGDPYVSSSLYASIEVHDMTLSIGLFPGGRIWESAEAIRAKAAGG